LSAQTSSNGVVAGRLRDWPHPQLSFVGLALCKRKLMTGTRLRTKVFTLTILGYNEVMRPEAESADASADRNHRQMASQGWP